MEVVNWMAFTAIRSEEMKRDRATARATSKDRKAKVTAAESKGTMGSKRKG